MNGYKYIYLKHAAVFRVVPSCYHLIPYNTSFGSLPNPMNNGNLENTSLKIIVIDNKCLQNRVPIISAVYSVC